MGYQGFFFKQSAELKNTIVKSESKADEDVTFEININSHKIPIKTEADTAAVNKTRNLAYLKVSADKKKKEIEQLMQEYDVNKSDKDKRASIKKKIDMAMTEYNKMILPIAVEQLKKSQ